MGASGQSSSDGAPRRRAGPTGGNLRTAVASVAPPAVAWRPEHLQSRIEISDAEAQALIAAALAEGRVTVCPPGFAWGAEPPGGPAAAPA
jgi:hypothetical protein